MNLHLIDIIISGHKVTWKLSRGSGEMKAYSDNEKSLLQLKGFTIELKQPKKQKRHKYPKLASFPTSDEAQGKNLLKIRF